MPSLQALPPPSHPAHTHPIWALKGVSLDTLDAAGRVRRPMRPHTFAHTQRGHRHPPTPLAHAGRGRICAGGASRATDAVGVVAGRAHGAVRTRLLVLQEACEAGLARRAAHFVLILATRACCGGGGMRGRVGRWVGRGARVRRVLAGLAIACHHRTVERGWGGMSAQGHAGRRRTDRPRVRGGF